MDRSSSTSITCFNPRTPCGVRHYEPYQSQEVSGFNPRTPCGVRPPVPGCYPSAGMFQSTHSLRSATQILHGFSQDRVVSIHALLAECDCPLPSVHCKNSCFNPRTPCGVRRIIADCTVLAVKFQSTHSLRSATG